MTYAVDIRLQTHPHGFGHKKLLICSCIDASADDRMVGFVFVNGTEVSPQKPHEGVEPLKKGHKVEQQQVVAVAQTYVFALVSKEQGAVVFVVGYAHHYVTKYAAWHHIARKEHDGVACVVGMAYATAHEAD